MGALLLLVSAAYFACFVDYGYHFGEDGEVVYLIYRTFSGQRPYVDFASGYTPGFFYGNAALFGAFGVDLRVLRWSMVAVNSLAVFTLYRVGVRALPPFVAAVPALAYAALMPLYAGEFATFNIPYPAWHVVLFWGLGVLAFLRARERRRPGWLFVAGALAAVGCAFKPNTGAFNLAALALLLLTIEPPAPRFLSRVVWWGLLLGVLGALAAVFGFRVADRDARLLLWPVFALAGIAAASSGLGIGQRDSGGRSADEAGFAPQALLLLAGFAAITLPWTAYYAAALGWERFLRDVLFIGSGHALFYYLPIRPLGAWDVLMALGFLAAFAVGGAQARRLLRPRYLLPLAAVALAIAAVALWRAPMPEGFQRAAMQRFEHLAYGAAILLHWAGVGLVAGSRFRVPGSKRQPTADPGTRNLEPGTRDAAVAIAVSAPLLFLSIYPRGDFFHWVLSAPFTLVLGVLLFWRLAERALAGAAPPAWLAAPLYAALLLAWWPGLALAARLATASDDAFVNLGLARAPLVLESGRADRLRALRQTVEYIQDRTEPSDTLLGFPNLQLLNLLSGRHVPGRSGSFHPGWPDHVGESRIVDDLERRQTPLVVVSLSPQLYIGNASVYYFLLADYLRHHFRLAAEFGGFQVLERVPGSGFQVRGDDSAAHSTAERGEPRAQNLEPGTRSCVAALAHVQATLAENATPLAPCFRAGEPLQAEAVAVARSSRDPRAAAALAAALAAGELDAAAALIAARAIGESGDARSFPDAVAALERVDGRVRDELTTALLNIAVRSFLDSQHVHPRVHGIEAIRADARLGEQAREWLASPDPRLRYAGAWVAGLRRDRAAVPALRRMLAQPPVEFQAQAAAALLEIGEHDGVAEPLVDGMAHDEMYLPTAMLAWSRANPERARELLTERFRRGNALQRESIAFLAGVLRDAALLDAVRAGREDPEPRVRAAAEWALGYASKSEPPMNTDAHRSEKSPQPRNRLTA